MHHIIDYSHTLINTFKEYPILAALISIVGIASGYAIGETHLPLLLMQILQILAWTAATLAASIPVISAVKKELIPWIKSFKKRNS